MPINTGVSLNQNTRNTDSSMHILKQNIGQVMYSVSQRQ